MASFTKQPSGKWRAQIRKNGKTLSKNFTAKADAKAWSTRVEAEIEANAHGGAFTTRLFKEALQKYLDEVAPTRKGYRWEKIRLTKLLEGKLAGVPMNQLNASHIATWRDDRLKDVSPSTVHRELGLISSVITQARREWRWIGSNPAGEIKRPRKPAPRDRRISAEEQEAILRTLNYDGTTVATKSQQLAVAFLLAIETAMRQGELLGLKWDNVNGNVVTLVDTKNGDKRMVPLSSRAVSLFDTLPRDREMVFTLKSASADTLFRKARIKAEIENLHFHDTRHEALTRLAGKLSVLELARMVGHRDLKSLMIYYNATPEELAAKLD